MQEQACVLLDIRACKAEEMSQEFVEYLSQDEESFSWGIGATNTFPFVTRLHLQRHSGLW